MYGIVICLLSSLTFGLIQPKHDLAHYEPFTLDNGLRVLLVSDPKAQKSAAAMTVASGHLDNPQSYPGLAHFLEHMLFLGTKQHPKVGEFQQYIQENSGHTNAFTSSDITAYHFTVMPSAFSEALTRFSEFFKDPLLDPTYVEKERMSVNAEWKMRFNNDGVRFISVNKQMLNPNHPYAAFDVGSNKSLAGTGDELVQALRQFYHRYYIANQMALVLVSSEPLLVMKQKVVARFSKIRSGPKNTRPKLPIWNATKPQEVAIQTAGKDSSLLLSFPMKNIMMEYPQAYDFLSFLIDRTDQNGLLEHLKPLGASDLSSSFMTYDAEQGTWLIEINLLPSGLSNKDQITTSVLSYLGQINQDVKNKGLFEELKRAGQTSFDYKAKGSELKQAIALSQAYLHHDEPLAFDHWQLGTPFYPKKIESLLDQVNQHHLRLYVLSPEGTYDLIETDYQTKYSVKDFQMKLMTKPINYAPMVLNKNLSKSGCHSQKVNGAILGESVTHQPLNSNILPGQSWAGLYLYPKRSLESEALWLLYSEIVRDKLKQYRTDFMVNHIHHDLVMDSGLMLSVSAFSPDVIKALQLMLNELSLEISQDQFQRSQKKLMDQLASEDAKPLYQQAFNRLNAILEQSHLPQTLRDQLQDLQYQDFIDHMRDFPVNTDVLLIGDVCESDWKILNQQLQKQWWKSEYIPHNQWPVSQLPEKALFSNKGNDHVMVKAYLPPIFGLQTLAKIMVLEVMLSKAYYHDMRTEKQVGYVVGVNSWSSYLNQALVFYMQSPTFNVPEMEKAHNLWVMTHLDHIKNMAASQFKSIQNHLLADLKRSPRELSDQAQRLIAMIHSGEKDMRIREQLLSEVARLSLEDMQQYYQFLLIDHPKTTSILHG